MISLTRPLRCLTLMVGLAVWSGVAHAACSSPDGQAGDLRYAVNYNTIAFCDGANWMSLAGWTAGSGGVTTLGGLTDVTTAGAATGSILAFDGANWVVSVTAIGSDALGARITSGTTHDTTHQNSSITFAVGGSDMLVVGSNKRIGVDTRTPSATVHVSGSLLVAGNDNQSCGVTTQGLIRRNATSGGMEICE